MKHKETILNKTVKVRSVGSLVGSTLVMAVVAGVFWHRRAIKRLIEIRHM